jgi:hypothetical protein
MSVKFFLFKNKKYKIIKMSFREVVDNNFRLKLLFNLIETKYKYKTDNELLTKIEDYNSIQKEKVDKKELIKTFNYIKDFENWKMSFKESVDTQHIF